MTMMSMWTRSIQAGIGIGMVGLAAAATLGLRSEVGDAAASSDVAMMATTTSAASSVAAIDAPYTVDGGHSSTVFRVTHLGVSPFYGRFNDIKGTFSLDPENLESGSVSIEINVESIDTNSDRRDRHLRSADFFDTNRFPTAMFESTAIRDTGGGNFEIDGDLTLHGVTKPITAKAEWIGSAENERGAKAGFGAEFTIKRADFGVNYMPDGLGAEVLVMVGVEGNRQP